MNLLRPLVIFDLETTGVDPKLDRIVELGFVKLYGSADTADEEGVLRFNPGCHIREDIAAIHHITDEMVKDAPPFKEVVSEVERVFKGADVAGYNIEGFDVLMLSEEFKRCDVSWPEDDTRVIDCFKILLRRESRTLSWALRFYCGRVHGNAHSAMADVRATLDVLHAQACWYKAEDTAALEAMGRDPSWLDRQGRIAQKDGLKTLTFGKHAGKSIELLPESYISWMIGSDFPDDTKEILREELRRRANPKIAAAACRSTQGYTR